MTDKPPLIEVQDCHTIENPFDYNMGAQTQYDSDIEWFKVWLEEKGAMKRTGNHIVWGVEPLRLEE